MPLDNKPVHGVCVLAIVVLFRRALGNVECWAELRDALGRSRLGVGTQFNVAHLLVYDNSPSPSASEVSSIPLCTYVHDAANGGTAAAYCYGARLAASLDLPWLLLLDQDTSIPPSFLSAASTALAKSAPVEATALLPWIMHSDRVISPARVSEWGRIRPLAKSDPIRADWQLTGIASGSFIRTKAFDHFEALPQGLWLDYVDHWMFRQLSQQRAPVGIIDCVLQHDLSVENPHQLTDTRLESILHAESNFISGFSWLARLLHRGRLAVRAARSARTRPDHALMILKHAFGHDDSKGGAPKR